MNSEKIKTTAARATVWSLLTQLAPKFITPVVNMILARLLAPEAFGAIATINLVITFAEVFTDAGFQKYIIQHEFEDEESLDKSTNVAFWTNIFVAMAFIAAIVIFRNPIASLVGSPDLGSAIAISSINILLVTLSSTQTARYNRSMNFKTLFYARICTIFLPLVVTVPLAFIMRNYWALLIGTLVTHFSNTLILTIFSKWRPKLYFSSKIFREMFGFSTWLLLDSIAIWLTSYIGTLMIGRALDAHHLGLYKTSITTVNSITNIIVMAIGPVMFSELSRCQNDDLQMKTTFLKYQRLSAIILIPLGIGMFIFKDLVTWVLLGPQWSEVVDFVGIWALVSTVGIVFSNFCSTYYRSKGKPRVALICQIAYLAVLIPAIAISVKHGFQTLFYVRSIVALTPVIISLFVMKVLFGYTISETIMNIFPTTLSALVMGGVGWLLKHVITSYIWQFVCVFICIVTYFTVLLLFPKSRKEIFGLDLVQKILKRKPKISESNE